MVGGRTQGGRKRLEALRAVGKLGEGMHPRVRLGSVPWGSVANRSRNHGHMDLLPSHHRRQRVRARHDFGISTVFHDHIGKLIAVSYQLVESLFTRIVE